MLQSLSEVSLASASTVLALADEHYSPPLAAPTMSLSFRCRAQRDPVRCIVNPTDPLATVTTQLLEKLGLPSDARPRLVFDGEQLDLALSPRDAGLEDDDLVEVCV